MQDSLISSALVLWWFGAHALACLMQDATTPNGTRVPPTAKVAQLITQSVNGPGQCNGDISGGTPLEAFQSIIAFLAGNGFYVVRLGELHNLMRAAPLFTHALARRLPGRFPGDEP